MSIRSKDSPLIVLNPIPGVDNRINKSKTHNRALGIDERPPTPKYDPDQDNTLTKPYTKKPKQNNKSTKGKVVPYSGGNQKRKTKKLKNKKNKSRRK